MGALVGGGSWFAAGNAALNGGFAGARGIYDFKGGSGFIAFAADSTWGLPGTTLGNAMNLWNTLSGQGAYSPGLSRRQNRQVFREGWYLKADSAHTQGNVISNLDTIYGSHSEGLLNHETAHIDSNRIGGPFYQVAYGVWFVGGAIVATGYVFYKALQGEKVNWWDAVVTAGYYDNPMERELFRHHNPEAYDTAPVDDLAPPLR